MKPTGPRNLGASVRQRLLNLAKERGEEFNFVLRRYGLERRCIAWELPDTSAGSY